MDISNNPLVSVVMITFNHEEYIEEAINGVLMQECNFKVEFIIADDCSLDKTDLNIKKVIQEHKKGNWIKYTKHKGNKGMMSNFIWAIKKTRGKYIALCEGDDYWTDPYKLQKQVDFLENNLDYNICFHDVKVFHQKNDVFINDNITPKKNETTDIIELAKGNYIHTPSVMLRNDFTLPNWFSQTPIGDWIIYMLIVKDKKIKRINKEMAVYRIHNSSIWSTKPKEFRIKKTILANNLLITSGLFDEKINKILSFNIQKFKSQIKKHSETITNNEGTVHKPLVSICIPTFNGEKYIAEAIQSALAQTYPNLEIIVSDDASTDNTLKIVENYNDKTAIPIHIHHHKPSEIGANWNNSIKKANGEYIKFLFQDDVLQPTCIEEMVEIIESKRNIAMVASKREFIFKDDYLSSDIKEWMSKYGDLQEKLRFQSKNGITLVDKTLFKSELFFKSPLNKIGEPSVTLFRKDIVDKIGYFREDLKQILDYEFCYRLLKVKKIAIINKNLVKFRLHNMQATNLNRGNDGSDYIMYNKLIFKEYFWLLNNKTKIYLLEKHSTIFGYFMSVLRKLKIV